MLKAGICDGFFGNQMFDDDHQLPIFLLQLLGLHNLETLVATSRLGAVERGASSHQAGFHFDYRATLASCQRNWSQFGVVEYVAGCWAGPVGICDRLAGSANTWPCGDCVCAVDLNHDVLTGAVAVNRIGQDWPVFTKIA